MKSTRLAPYKADTRRLFDAVFAEKPHMKKFFNAESSMGSADTPWMRDLKDRVTDLSKRTRTLEACATQFEEFNKRLAAIEKYLEEEVDYGKTEEDIDYDNESDSSWIDDGADNADAGGEDNGEMDESSDEVSSGIDTIDLTDSAEEPRKRKSQSGVKVESPNKVRLIIKKEPTAKTRPSGVIGESNQ